MSVQTTTTAAPAVTSTSERSEISPVGEILRDIARGGLAGAIIGIVVVGLGGRLVMRLAAILQPQAVGAITENGNRIGSITAAGTFSLVVNGLVVGLMAGTIWVIVSPWIPGVGLRRAIVTVPVAIALSTSGLIESDNPDFAVLRHDSVVVLALIVLVGLVGLAIPLLDDRLDGRLPHTTPDHSGATWTYAILALLGAVLILPIVVASYLLADHQAMVRVGLALLVVGLATLAWWVLRVRGHVRPSITLTVVGRSALFVAAVLGAVATVPEVADALGMM